MLQQSSPVQVRCFEMSQLLCGMFPIFPVFEEESATATRASAGSPRWTQRCAIKSCITGCRDDRGVRGCLSHHHTCCSFVPLWLSLLFCFILSHLLSRSVSCPVFFSLVLSLNQSCCFSPPKNIFFTFSIVLHQALLLLTLVVFGRGSCKHSCLCLHICIQHHRLRLMAWLSPLQPEWMTALLPLMFNTQPVVDTSTGFFYWLECTYSVQSGQLTCVTKDTVAETVFSQGDNGTCKNVVCMGSISKHSCYDNFTSYSAFIDPGWQNHAVNESRALC